MNSKPTQALSVESHTATPWAEGPYFQESIHDLPEEVRNALQAVGVKKKWKKGAIIQKQGRPLNHVNIFLNGRFAVTVTSPSGIETLLRFVVSAEIIGLNTILAELPAPTSIVSTIASETLMIQRSDFIDVLSRYPQAAIEVAKLLSNRLAELFSFVEMTSHRTLNERVIYALRRLVRRYGEAGLAGTTRLKVTQSELSAAAGASRQRVHLELKRLESVGLIELGYGQIIVKTHLL